MGQNFTGWPRYGVRVWLDPLTPTDARATAEIFGEALLAHHPLAYTDGELWRFLMAWLEIHRARAEPVPWPFHLIVRRLEPATRADEPPDRAEVLVAYLHELVGALPPGLQPGAMGAVVEVLTALHAAADVAPPPFLSLARDRSGPRLPSRTAEKP